MFSDARSKNIVLVAHCVLNQNAISDGTADFAGVNKKVVDVLSASNVGILQMPCPELMCLGLDRGNKDGGASPVLEENTRIRRMMMREPAGTKLRQLVQYVVFQILEYQRHDFNLMGIVGINRSPSCGVETTSLDNREVDGQGVFIEALREELENTGIQLDFAGIKASEQEKTVKIIQNLMGDSYGSGGEGRDF